MRRTHKWVVIWMNAMAIVSNLQHIKTSRFRDNTDIGGACINAILYHLFDSIEGPS